MLADRKHDESPCAVDFHGYEVNEDTRVAFARRASSPWPTLAVGAASVAFLVLLDFPEVFWVIFALLSVINAFFPGVNVIAIEEADIVFVSTAWIRHRVTSRIPFEAVRVLRQGEGYRDAYLCLHLYDGSTRNIGFLGGGRRPRPCFATTLNRTSFPFPSDPRASPDESATVLVRYLMSRGVKAERVVARPWWKL